MTWQTIDVRQEDRVAYITLNRPRVMNAVNTEMVREIRAALKEAESDRHLRAIVLEAAGPAFCTGADLKDVLQACRGDYRLYMEFLAGFHETCLALHEHPLPTIAAVHGYCLAGGLELTLSCDFAIAADDAVIGDQHANYGFAGAANLWLVAQRIGAQRALEVLLTGKWLSGKDAAACGLVLRSVPADTLRAEVDALTAGLKDKSRSTAQVMKRLLHRTASMPAREALDIIYADVINYMALAPDAREGLEAFAEKRKPKFD